MANPWPNILDSNQILSADHKDESESLSLQPSNPSQAIHESNPKYRSLKIWISGPK